MAPRPISTGVEQATRMQFELEKAIVGCPEVELVFGRTGTAEMATDPMTPNLTDTFLILKSRDRWPDPKLPKEELIRQIEERVARVPGNAYEFTQPIQMRFNELIAGVRSDVAVKVYGDDFTRHERDRGKDRGRAAPYAGGSKTSRSEQTEGLADA